MTSRATASPSAPAVEVALTQLAAGAGCGCKLPAEALLPLLANVAPAAGDPRVLVDGSTSDDAAVFALGDELALVQTVDFFTPPVDDPYDFGRIAAANAISDIYAMGAQPLLALSIVGFPLERLGPGVLEPLMRGGLAVADAAGVSIVGGHSISDPEPKYGLAVTGVAHPAQIVRNSGGRPGDALLLSKPLGAGTIVSAHQRGHADAELLAAAVEAMVELNAAAARAALAAGVHAMTDVTGFGLLGHLHHVCRESGLAAELDSRAVPTIAGVEQLLREGRGVSGGTRRNAGWASRFTEHAPAVEPWRRTLLADATTSGGLLTAIPDATHADAVCGPVIGRLIEGPAGTIRVV